MPIFKSPAQKLLSAAKRGEWAKVDELLRQGVAPTYADQNGWTPLHWAAWEGHVEVVNRLLQSPLIDKEARTLDKSRTPIYLAACVGHEQVFAALLEAGARVNVSDNGGYTILHAAAEAGHRTVVRLLLDHLEGSTELVVLLEAVDHENRWTALHWAAYQGHSAVVRRLVDAGADAKARDPQGRTAADIACTSGNLRVKQYRDYVLQELQRAATSQAPLDHLPASDPLPALASWNGSLTAEGLRAAAMNRPGQSPPASHASGSERHSAGFSGFDPGLPNASSSYAATSTSGSQLLPTLPPSTPTTASTLPLSAGMGSSQIATTSSSAPASPQGNLPGASSSVQLRQAGLSTYPTVRYSASSLTGSLGSAHSAAQRRALAAAQRGVDIRQAPDQTSSMSRSPETSSWDGARSAPADQRPPGRAPELHAIGGGLGAGMGAMGTGIVMMGGVMAAVGAVATGNPGALLQGLFNVAVHLMDLCEDAIYCRYKSAMLKERTQALKMCLQALQERLPMQVADLEAALERTLLSLQKVLQNVSDLIVRFSSRSDNLFGRTMEFLRSMGFRDEFEILDSELHSCTSQLMLVLQISSMVPASLPKPLQELQQWQQQNQLAREKDMKELEERMLAALCGLGKQGMQMSQAVKRLEVMLQANNHDMRQMVTWLERMDAGHVMLSDHLQRMADRVDEVAEMTELILTYLQPSQRRGRRNGDSQPPPFLIPMSSIHLDDVPQEEPWGGFGFVVKAFRDRFGLVAIKMYNINQVGDTDMEAAVREAVKLCRVNHHNVVRCFGILTDEVNPGGRNSKSGSLVMEWVEGGDMYRWLQRHDLQHVVSLEWRAQLMLQVAAGMKHLHQQKLVHGDIKPQNMLLQFTDKALYAEDGTLLEIVPIVVKICDFGLAKYNATSMSSRSTALTVRGCTPRYTSPDRLRTMDRSYEDDIYAFGMLMYFAATSQEPFGGCSDQELYTYVSRGNRPNIDGWAAQYRGTELQRLALMYADLAKRCWQQLPEDRPAGGFKEIYQALEEMLWPSSVPHVE